MFAQHKKIILLVLAVLLASTLLAAGGSTKVAEITFGETTDVSLGRAGLVFSGSQYTGTVKITRIDRGNLPGAPVPDLTQKPIMVRLYNEDNQKITHVIGPVYVYFKIRGPEQRLWNKDELTIYYYDSWKNEWTVCPTTYIFKAGASRVSCRVRAMGLYGVGVK